jgi:light-regulated signal transduction histidine kinase (bacteriophytochrome)
VKAPPVPLMAAPAARHDPVDLSMSVLRSVSPIHIEYLSNMGVGASMSVSILREGKLWGLFACHHYGPHVISFERRTAAELFGQMFSWLLEARENEQTAEYEGRARQLQERIVASMGSQSDARAAIEYFASEFKDIIACDGIGVWNDGRITLSGVTPTEEQFTDLVRFLNRTVPGRTYATHQLSSVYSEASKMAGEVAGILAVPISRSPRDYLMFFRTEVSRTVTWAGDPSKPMVTGPHGERLTPRKSFEAWREVVRGQSAPWRDADMRIADQLRITLLEVILRLVDVAEKERRAAQERQELLIAELNHRVRNILSLIRGIISQSRATSGSVEEFAAVVGGRIQALGRAHDQLTKSNFAPGALDTLLKSEVSAYLGDKIDRVRMSGPDIALDSKAFSTLALVIHEMMTNSAKYGALCDSTGEVDVNWHLDAARRLVIEWREKGGPVVHPPRRRGFGTTIIERSIPFDLNGEAEVTFDLLGVRARFVVPPAFLHLSAPNDEASAAIEPLRHRISGNALIVEDNLIIAVNAEAILLELGADQVEIAGGVQDALQLILRRRPDFALLDLNLGTETSLPVAARLVALQVPFVFATGYGDRAPIPDEMTDVPVIQKPYLTEVIQAALGRIKR